MRLRIGTRALLPSGHHMCRLNNWRRTSEAAAGSVRHLRAELLPDAVEFFRVTAMVEKPTIQLAGRGVHRSRPRLEEYLCLLGMHVCTTAIFECLGSNIAHAGRQRRNLGSRPHRRCLPSVSPTLSSEPVPTAIRWVGHSDWWIGDPYPGRAGAQPWDRRSPWHTSPSRALRGGRASQTEMHTLPIYVS